jgi:hypothetical protein
MAQLRVIATEPPLEYYFCTGAVANSSENRYALAALEHRLLSRDIDATSWKIVEWPFLDLIITSLTLVWIFINAKSNISWKLFNSSEYATINSYYASF